MEPFDPKRTTSETEDRILEAALETFARTGKDGARMQEIADRAGINKALLHYYFRSKDRLYEEVFGFMLRRFTSTFVAALNRTNTFEEALGVFVEGYISFIDQHLQVTRLILNEIMAGAPVMKRLMPILAKVREDLPPIILLHRLEKAIAEGEVRPVDPYQTLITIISSCVLFFVAYPVLKEVIPEAAADRAAFIQARKKHICDLIYHGLKPEPPGTVAP